MSKTFKIALAGLFLTAISPNLAAAQSNLTAAQSTCSCSATSSATVISVNGDVTTSGAFGFVAGEPGQVLSAGSEVYTGSDSSANLSFGPNCNLRVPAQSKLVIVSQSGSNAICAEVSDASAGDVSTSAAGASAGTIALIVLAAGGLIWAVTDDDDNFISP